VAFRGNRRDSYMSWWEDLRARDYLQDLLIDVRIILNGSSGSGMGRHGLD
jgi:hypothetical protein